MVKTVEISHATLTQYADGVMYFHYHDNLYVDLEAAKAIIHSARAEMETIAPRPTIVDISGVKGVSREARHYLSTSPDNMSIASGVAMIAGNPISRVIGNFFLGLNRPPIPVKLFGDFESARAWLTT